MPRDKSGDDDWVMGLWGDKTEAGSEWSVIGLSI
jgi:hypothetical protein